MPTVILTELYALIGIIRAHLQKGIEQGSGVAEEASRVLALLEPLPPLTGEFPRNRHAATRHLAAAFDATSPATANLVEAIRPLAGRLPWRYSYPKRKDAPGLGQEIAFAEIIGPEAPFHSERVCLGLTLIGPHTLYPAHAHPATELYYVISGAAEWTAAGISRRNAPGAFILHPSLVVHAMQTGEEPLLAVYTWSGNDVKTTSSYTQPPSKIIP